MFNTFTGSPLSSAETDAAIKGVIIGVTIRVRHVLMHADCSSSNYSAKANLKIEIMKGWAHRKCMGTDSDLRSGSN